MAVLVFNKVANRSSDKDPNRAIGSIFIIVRIAMIFIGYDGGGNAYCATLARLLLAALHGLFCPECPCVSKCSKGLSPALPQAYLGVC